MWLLLGIVALLVSWVVAYRTRISAHWKAEPGVWKDVQYLSSLHTHKQRTTWRLGLKATRRPDFQLKGQGDLDAFFHRIGISDEVQTADSRFDRTFYVACDHPVLRQQLLQSAPLRKAFCELHHTLGRLGWKFRQIRLAEERLWVEATGSSGMTPPALVLALPPLVDALEQLPVVPPGTQPDPYFLRAGLWLALSSALGICGWLSLYDFWGTSPLLDLTPSRHLSWWLGPLFGLLLAWLAMHQLRRSARSHFVLIEWLTIGLFGCWALTLAGSRRLNVALDFGPSIRAESKVLSVYSKRSGKRGRRYWIAYDSIPAHGIPRFDLQVSYSEYQQASEDTCHALVLRPGAFGWTWVESRRELPAAEATRGCGDPT